MFCDGSKIYDNYSKTYKKHKKGYVILGPPGIGKTHYVKHQKENNWIDQDDLYNDLGVEWHYKENDKKYSKLNYLRADYISEQTKLLGYRIIGSLFWNYKADAIVIPPIELHKHYLLNRYDLDLEFVLQVRNILLEQSKKDNIPLFTNINSAIQFLETSDINNK